MEEKIYQFLYVFAKNLGCVPGIRLEWGAKDVGFGELDLVFDDDGKLIIHSEAMGKDFVRQLLNHWVESGKLAD